MAGDWIKMRADLQTHPKVVRIMSAICPNKFQVIGGLHAIWSIFDVHSENGELSGYSLDMMDAVIGWPGFSKAVASVGWLEETPESLVMPEFHSHNGQSAKRRSEDAKRKKQERYSAKCPKLSGQTEEKKRTREEKRRYKEIYKEIVDLYHEILPSLPSVQMLSEKREKYLDARIDSSDNTKSSEWWREFFEKVSASDFLMGRKTDFRADFEWLITQGNFIKVVEGKYDNR